MSTASGPAEGNGQVLLELVRPEAIAARNAPAAHDASAGRLVDFTGRSRAHLGFLALVVATALVVWTALTVHVDQRANGQARVVRDDGRTVVMALPIGVQAQLRPGLPVRFRVGGREFDGRLVSVLPPEDAASASRLIGRRVDGAAAAVARATLGDDAAELERHAVGTVSVRVKRQRLWDLISPGKLFDAGNRG